MQLREHNEMFYKTCIVHGERTQATRDLERKTKELEDKMKRRKLSNQMKAASKNPAFSLENRERMASFEAKLNPQKRIDVSKILTKDFVNELKDVRAKAEQKNGGF